MKRNTLSILATALAAFALLTGSLPAQTPIGTIKLGPPLKLTGPGKVLVNPLSNKVYLFGGNLVDVIDLSLNQVTNTIALPPMPPSAGVIGASGAWMNTALNRILLFRGNQFVVIDGSRDIVIQTLSLPATINSSYGPISYNAALNKFYVGEIAATSPNGGEVRILDGATFATSAIIPVPNVNYPLPPSENPEQILINPANNRVYVLYSISGVQVIDGASDTVVATAACAATCNGLAFPPGINGAMINPADNSVWVAYSGSIPGPPGGEDGAGGIAGPPFTVFWRIDAATNAVAMQFQIFGRETELLGFDPNTGLMYMMATDLPTVPNPLPTSPVISAIETMLVVLDPNNLTPTVADPSPMRRITVDGTLLANNGTPFSCGKGVQAFEPITLDLTGQNIYWRCDSTTRSFSSIVLSKLSFTSLGNVNYSRLVGQMPTTAGGQITAHAIPVGISKDFDFGANIGGNHAAMFFSGGDNLFFAVNPSLPALTTIPLGALPAGIAIDPANHRAYVTDLSARALSVVDTAALTLVTKAPAPGGSLIAANGLGQYVLAGPTDPAADPIQVNGGFLFDGRTNSVSIPLQASATSAISVNPATNAGYFADGSQWIAVDLATGARRYSVTDLTAAGTDICQMSGISVSKANNRVFVAGKCAAGGNTLAVFDGASHALIASTNVDTLMQTIGRLIVNPNTNLVYVEATNPSAAPGGGMNVEVFDGATLAHTNSIANRKGPFAVNTVTSMVYAAYPLGGAAAIDGLAPEQSSSFGTTQVVSALAVDEINNTVYLGSYSTYLGICCTPSVPVFQADSGTVSIFHQDAPTYLVQGLVTSAGVPQTGITVTVSGPGGSFSQVTGPNGIFAGRLVPGTYTVTPANPSFQFSPASQIITLGQIDQTVPTFLATPVFHITGSVFTVTGAPVAGVTISATGVTGNATAVTSASGQYSLAGLPAGTYTVTPTSPANFYSPISESVQVNKTDAAAPQFTVNPSLQITAFSLSSNLLGAGVTATGTVTINVVAPKGGIPITLSSSDTKTVKPPSSFTIPAGANSGSFSFSGSGTATVTLTATYSGTLAIQPSSATAQVSIVGTDTVHVTSATWSTSTQVLNVTATSTNPGATLTVTLASNGQNLGTMTSQGNGTFTLQTQVASKPSSINVKSTLGGSTGQGVSNIP